MKKKDIASKEAKRKAATRKQIDTPGGGATFGEGTDCDGGVRQEQDAAGPVALIRGHERANSSSLMWSPSHRQRRTHSSRQTQRRHDVCKRGMLTRAPP